MSLRGNLKANIKLDRLFQSLLSTTREPPGRRWLNKELTQELLAWTDFEHKRVRDLHLYIRPLEGEIMEVAFRSRVGHAICARQGNSRSPRHSGFRIPGGTGGSISASSRSVKSMNK